MTIGKGITHSMVREPRERKESPKLEKLKLYIDRMLEDCNAKDTPFVCNELGTEGGPERIKEMILNLVIEGNLNISDAIISIEQEYNPNIPD